MKPLTMLEFVLKSNDLESIKNYAKFLSQKPEKWMFVPCDDEGNVLEEPVLFKEWIVSDHYFNASESVTHQCRMYQQALDRVIFEGFTSHNKHWLESEKISFFLINNNLLAEYKNIYDLINEYGDFLTLKKPIQ